MELTPWSVICSRKHKMCQDDWANLVYWYEFWGIILWAVISHPHTLLMEVSLGDCYPVWSRPILSSHLCLMAAAPTCYHASVKPKMVINNIWCQELLIWWLQKYLFITYKNNPWSCENFQVTQNSVLYGCALCIDSKTKYKVYLEFYPRNK